MPVRKQICDVRKNNYEILGPAEKNGKNVPQLYRSGMFGEIAWTDCKTFAEACYELAEAELKKAYISAFGRDVDVSAKTILNNTANSIMELLNEDVLMSYGSVWSARRRT